MKSKHDHGGDLLSKQVVGSRYFFLDLTLRSRRGWGIALGGRERCSSDYQVERDSYPYHVLEYVVEGRGEVVLDGRRGALGPGALLSYAPSTRFEIRSSPEEPMLKFFFALSGGAAAGRLIGAGMPAGSLRMLLAHGEIRSIAEDLLREGGRGGVLAGEICRTLFELLLLKVSDAATWADHGSPIARDNFLKCRALIDAQPESFRSLEQVAEAAGMDVSSICRLFRRFQGSSPYQYLLRKKMSLAAELLVDQGCLVKEAAQRVGFNDPFHFARCFKAIHGVAPSAVRGLSQGGRI